MSAAVIAALILLNICTLVAAGVQLDRQATRAERERTADREERQVLLQRIQAPQAAVYEHHAAVAPAEEPVPSVPMSDEEIAAMQSRQVPPSELEQLIARMEAAENGIGQIEDGLLP